MDINIRKAIIDNFKNFSNEELKNVTNKFFYYRLYFLINSINKSSKESTAK